MLAVAVVGAGSLGAVYGGRLSALADVTFVVRASHPRGPMILQRIEGGEGELVLQSPAYAESVPPAADVILLCVRAEQLGEDVLTLLRGGAAEAPVVVFTPMLEKDRRVLTGALGERLVAAMPGVVAQHPDENKRVRYWLPKIAPTLIERTARVPEVIPRLVSALEAAGMTTRLEPDVSSTNEATTLSFIPLTMGLDVAGSIDAFLADDALLALALEAAEEGVSLGRMVGKPAGWVNALMRFVGPITLKIGVSLARVRSAEAVRYVEDHFGSKLHAQNVAMAESMLALATEKGAKREALEKLLARLRARG